jgi:hypothetical protein
MSASQEAFETIVAAVPEFRPQWQEFLASWQGGETPWYLAMGALAHYVVDAYECGKTAQFKDLFSAIELVLQNADSEVQNLLWVGHFESIQNVASHRSFGASVFRPWLGPESLIVWGEVDRGTQKVAAWVSSQKPRWWQFWRRHRSFDPEGALSQAENLELRKIIEQSYRRESPPTPTTLREE